jgi:hypothetical protein
LGPVLGTPWEDQFDPAGRGPGSVNRFAIDHDGRRGALYFVSGNRWLLGN